MPSLSDSTETHDPVSKHEKQGSLESKRDSATVDSQSNSPDVPDGGLKAWMTVAGGWLILFSTFGYLYSFGVYEGHSHSYFEAGDRFKLFPDYYVLEYLNNHTPSSIAWIGSFQLMMPFALGIVSGKLFDSGYFHAMEIIGCVLFTVSLFMLSLAKPLHYYQIFLSQGVGMGLGAGILFVPTVSITSHHFSKRRSLATGVVLSGISAGATVFPILLNHYIPKIGFASTVRASGYVVIGTLAVGNALMRTRPRPPRATPDIKSFFKDGAYLWAILGTLLSSTGVYLPVIYIQLFAVQHSVGSNLAFYSIAIMNGTSAFGRIAANYLADIHGPFYLHVVCTLITSGTIWAVLGIHNSVTLVLVSTLYGIFSGAWLALSIACLASLAHNPEEVGARTGIALALGSFGALGAAPIQGALLTRDFFWIRPVAFSASIMVASACCFVGMTVLLGQFETYEKILHGGIKISQSALPTRDEVIAIFDGHFSSNLWDFALKHIPPLAAKRFSPTTPDTDVEQVTDFDRALLEIIIALFDSEEDWSDVRWIDRANGHEVIGYDQEDSQFREG
ncbi:MFS general substrate transporter [Mycena venus]|uniref:MFS general substrate transporter n=1 Tax=Mycena venus TaxID=2733690 RepID=A0A8H6XHF2_9AGAR|nr:MFS general substrate transporter [Mycena venus]